MFVIEIANVNIGIDNKYPYLEKLCKDFIVEKDPLFTVSSTEDEIDESIKNSKLLHTNSRGYYESLCVYRKIAQEMVAYDGFLMHGAVIEKDGKGYLFTAPSGTGKTTHTKLWKELYNAEYINGDKPIIRLIDGEFYACGTPWRGKECFGKNAMVKLHALCFIERDVNNSIRKLSAREVLLRVFNQLLLPNDDVSDNYYGLIDQLLSNIPCYLLRCNMDEEAAKVAYEGMK